MPGQQFLATYLEYTYELSGDSAEKIWEAEIVGRNWKNFEAKSSIQTD